MLFFLSVCVLGFGQLELTGRDASIAADDLSTILHDGLEYAVASVEENRRQAEMSQQAQPKFQRTHVFLVPSCTPRALDHATLPQLIGNCLQRGRDSAVS